MQQLENILLFVLKQILGRTLIGNWETDPWAMVFHLLGMIASIWWLYKLNPKIPETLGKTCGGVVIALLMISLGSGILLGFTYGLARFAVSAIASGAGSVPIIGGILKWIVEGIGAVVIPVAIGLAVGVFILMSFKSTLTTIWEIFKGFVSNPRDEEGNVKKSYSFAAILVVAGIINRPELNEGIALGLKDAIEIDWLRTTISYTPQIINGGLALFCLIWRTEKGTQKVVDIQARRSGEPRPDGSWACPNENLAPVIVNGQPIKNPDGSPKMTRRRCKGPEGEPYNGWNPPEARYCLSDECDHPNPYWQQCWKDQGGCGNAGEKGYGFRRNPDHVATCTKCGKVWPRLPRSTPFHEPGEDHSNAETVATQAAQTYAGQPTSQVPGMPTASLPWPNVGGYPAAPAPSGMPSWFQSNADVAQDPTDPCPQCHQGVVLRYGGYCDAGCGYEQKLGLMTQPVSVAPTAPPVTQKPPPPVIPPSRDHLSIN